MFSYYINIYLQFLVRTDYIIIHKDAGRFHSTYYVRYSLRQLKLLILIKKQKEYVLHDYYLPHPPKFHKAQHIL